MDTPSRTSGTASSVRLSLKPNSLEPGNPWSCAARMSCTWTVFAVYNRPAGYDFSIDRSSLRRLACSKRRRAAQEISLDPQDLRVIGVAQSCGTLGNRIHHGLDVGR